MFGHSEAHPWPFFFASRLRGRGRHEGPPFLFEMFGGRPQRAERGEVRYLILDALREKARHGYEIIQAIEERSGGSYRPSPGTIYPTLQLLEELGQIRGRDEAGKRCYELAPGGERELESHVEEVADAYERLRGENDWLDASEIHTLMRRLHRLMRGVGRAFRRGTLRRSELRRVTQIVEDALGRIEQLVTGGETPSSPRAPRT
jgi:DNA-binding PadR family transcriptional regulator